MSYTTFLPSTKILSRLCIWSCETLIFTQKLLDNFLHMIIIFKHKIQRDIMQETFIEDFLISLTCISFPSLHCLINTWHLNLVCTTTFQKWQTGIHMEMILFRWECTDGEGSLLFLILRLTLEDWPLKSFCSLVTCL